MTNKLSPTHNEYDMVAWALYSHNAYQYDKLEQIQNILVEWFEHGLFVFGKYYPGVWTVDWSGYY